MGIWHSWDIAQALEQMLPCVYMSVCFPARLSIWLLQGKRPTGKRPTGIPHDTSPLTIHVAVHVLLVLV